MKRKIWMRATMLLLAVLIALPMNVFAVTESASGTYVGGLTSVSVPKNAGSTTDTVTVHVRIPESWGRNPYLWAWEISTDEDAFAQWPGKPMVWDGEWYIIEIPSWCDGIVVNDGKDMQTMDLSVTKGRDVWIVVNSYYDCDISYLFSDVSQNAWYYDAVEFTVNRGYFSGYKSGKFGPEYKITREDFVVVLARIEGVNLSKYSGRTAFSDVPAGSYYEAAVKWASTTGVVMGYQNGKFGVGDKLTREQLVTILYRYAQKKGCDMSVNAASLAKLKVFKDYGSVSSYARTALAWALQRGVIGGLNATTLGPQNTANRAQVAQILMNISKNKILPI